jgi:uncharacterized protein
VSPHEDRTLVRTINWLLVADSGSERADLWQDRDGWAIEGTVNAFVEEPIRVAYAVRCSPDWKTRAVTVNESRQDGERSFELVANDERRWWMDGEPVPALEGCVDVDLGVTPSTNTLPIRRLGLEVGESAEIDAAWIRFPELDVVRASQRYTRLSDRHYLYQSKSFQAEIDVDDLGLVVTYAGIWKRDGDDGTNGQPQSD